MNLRGPLAWHAARCVLCAVLVWRFSSPFEGTEFSGGMISGRVLELSDAGLVLFVVAIPAAFVSERIAAAGTVLASLLCLPLYFFCVLPGAFRAVFGGEFSAPLQKPVVWETWAVLGILTLMLVGRTEVRSALRSLRVRKSSARRER